MTTKAEERHALEEIRKILSRFEPDSYLNTAFDGCLMDAEDNINNDFMMSWKQRAASAAEAEKLAKEENAELSMKCKDIQNLCDHLTKYINGLEKQKDEMIRDMTGTNAALKETKETCDKQANEILCLKAKLYDFMTKEAK